MKHVLIKYITPLVVLFFGVGAFALLDVAKPEPQKKTEPPRPLSVYVEPAEQVNMTLLVSTEGEVRARTQVNLVAQVAGRVVSVSPEFTEGGIVIPGLALISIESTDYQLALSKAQAQVAGAEVGVQEALAAADVAQKQLRNASNASPLALKIPQVARARAQLDAARAELAQTELNLSRTRISLPFHGRVVEKLVDVGQYVSPGTPLGKAFSTAVVEVRLPFDDSQLASLGLPIGFVATDDNPIKVNLSALVAGKMQHWKGELVRLDAAIDSESRTLYGQVEVVSPYAENVSQFDMPLAVGLYVKAEIEGRYVENATVIPRQALRAGNRVFVVNDAGRLEVRTVSVVYSSLSEAVIGDGISPNDQVIVSSIRNPIPGMSVSALRAEAESVLAGGE